MLKRPPGGKAAPKRNVVAEALGERSAKVRPPAKRRVQLRVASDIDDMQRGNGAKDPAKRPQRRSERDRKAIRRWRKDAAEFRDAQEAKRYWEKYDKGIRGPGADSPRRA